MTLQRKSYSSFSLSCLMNGYWHNVFLGLLVLSISDISVLSTREYAFFFFNHYL